MNKDLISQAVEEFRNCFVETECGLDHANGDTIRKAGEKLISALTQQQEHFKKQVEGMEKGEYGQTGLGNGARLYNQALKDILNIL